MNEADVKRYDENTSMTSVVSYPERCSLWGESRFRGNCDGTLFKDLVLRYGARRVADPMMGSGTTRDVVAGLNQLGGRKIEYWGSDLQQGFNLLADPLPGRFDFVWIHPPYWNIIPYSDGQREDLSQIADYEDFRIKLAICLQRCSEALLPGGRLAVLIGDVRRKGCYIPIVRDLLNLEATLGQLRSIIIKQQHNCASDRKRYGRMEDVPIQHEYCLVFKRQKIDSQSRSCYDGAIGGLATSGTPDTPWGVNFLPVFPLKIAVIMLTLGAQPRWKREATR